MDENTECLEVQATQAGPYTYYNILSGSKHLKEREGKF